jgi:PIN domain
MEYDAITLDANVFIRNALNLEGGMLAQLQQFKEGSVEFVLSEIVLRELAKHLKAHAQEARDALHAAIKKAGRNALLTAQAIEQANGIHAGAQAPCEAAKARLGQFMDKSGCSIVAADKADMKELIKMYFDSAPPFEETGKKRKEFPDAIALLTLEAWAKENNKKILAISEDKGWDEFGTKSEWITVEKELPPALQKLQEHADAARKIVAQWLSDMDQGKSDEMWDELDHAVARTVEDLSPEIEASSGYYYDHELPSVTFSGMELSRDENNEFDFYIVQIGKDKIVARVELYITAHVETTFQFQVYDGIDKDYVQIGDCAADQEVNFNAGALVTLEGDFGKNPPEFDLVSVELLDALDSVDFGDVRPDYSNDDRE